MPLTPNLTVVAVTGTYVDIQGNPIAGQVKFTPRAIVTDAVYGQIVIANTITVTLDTNGSFTTYLPATDDPDTVPTGFTYLVEESFSGGRQYDIAVPQATVGSLNLASVVPSVADAGTASLYVSAAQYTNVNARLIVVEGYSSTLVSSATAATSSLAAANAAQSSASTAAASAATAATNAGTAATAAGTAATAATTAANAALDAAKYPSPLMMAGA